MLQCATAEFDNGRVTIVSQGDDRIVLYGAFMNLTPGKHGFHIHAPGSFGASNKGQCDKAGPHLVTGRGPYIQTAHGGRHSRVRHAGDLGNVFVNDDGVALLHMVVFGLQMSEILGCTLMLHEQGDDLGHGRGESHVSGNSGNNCSLFIHLINVPATANTLRLGKRMACATIVPSRCTDERFELPDPEMETYGTTVTVGEAFDMGDELRDEILLYAGPIETYGCKVSHDRLAELFELFTNASVQDMLVVDAHVADCLQWARKFKVDDWIHILTVAREHEAPLVYLYVIDLLLRRDDYKLYDPLDGYDMIGYTLTQRERIKDTLDFYAQLTLPVAARVLGHFIDDGPPINSQFLRAPFPIRWITRD